MKKKTVLSAAALVLCFALVLAGCGKKGSEGGSSQAAADSQTVDCEYVCEGTGYGFDLPESVKFTKGFLGTYDLGDLDYDSGVMLGWPVSYDMSKEEYNALTNEEAYKVHTGFSFQIICVKDVKTEEEAKEKVFAVLAETEGEASEADQTILNSLKMIHQEEGYVWLCLMNDKAEDIREECREEYNAFYDASEEILAGMKFFTPKVWKGGEEGTVLSFETIDTNGNPVDSKALFAQNKVTMINIWGTTCGPCIGELPELEKMNKEFNQKGGAIVGLVNDVWVNNSKYLGEARDILSDTGVTYTNLCAWEGYNDVLPVVGTPTTYFVDSQGKLIGDPILGADPAKYVERMEEYLSQAE
ncbi:MAG: TlpA family protein disulfide reductase [Lachnospiraceae bacterium]|nr:TlpA family protein disulfide reductase [Lachnospiraceae bacterium]